MEGDKKKKNPIIGILLGVAFMVLGLLHFTNPELFVSSTPGGRSFAVFTGALFFILGLLEILYIAYKRGDIG